MLTEKEMQDITGKDIIEEPNAADGAKSVNQTVEEYTCSTCGRTFGTKGGWLSHQKSHKSKNEDIPIEPSKKGTQKITEALPENISYLRGVLKSFGAKGQENIIAGMLDNPTDLTELRDLLGANENKSNVPYILKRYSNFIGKPYSSDENRPGSDIANLDDDLAYEQKLYRMQLYKQSRGTLGGNDEVSVLKSQVNELKDMLIRQEQNRELALIKEDLKKTKEESQQQVGSFMAGMKEFFTENEHKWQMHLKDEQHKQALDMYAKKLEELKQEIQNVTSNSNKTLSEKVLDKIDQTVNNAGASFAGALKEQINNEKVDFLIQLMNRNVPVDQAMGIAGIAKRPGLQGSSQLEWERLQKVAAEKQPVPVPAPVPAPVPVPEPDILEQTAKLQEAKIKFAVN